MIYAYIRVSTDKQTTENQRFEINQYCNSHNLKVDKFINETISGKVAIDYRVLGKAIKTFKAGDLLIITELSRLGRSLLDVMEKLNYLMKKKINLYSIKEKFTLDDSINAKVIAFAFSLSAEIERQLISQRTKEALARLKAEGKVLGRPIGMRNKKLNQKCLNNHELIIKWFYSEVRESVSDFTERLNIAKGTLYRYLAYIGVREPNTFNFRKGNLIY